jgi:hypothetical protein
MRFRADCLWPLRDAFPKFRGAPSIRVSWTLNYSEPPSGLHRTGACMRDDWHVSCIDTPSESDLCNGGLVGDGARYARKTEG